MDDTELRNILLGIQNNVIILHSEIAETRSTLHNEIVETKENLQNQMKGMQNRMEGMQNQMESMQNRMEGMQNQIDRMQNQIGCLQKSVKKIELTIENDINVKISALFDSRMDEIRHRKENMETNAKVANLEMRVDNLEKAIIAS